MRVQIEISVFKFPPRSVETCNAVRFQSETSVFKFFCLSVILALLAAVSTLLGCYTQLVDLFYFIS